MIWFRSEMYVWIIFSHRWIHVVGSASMQCVSGRWVVPLVSWSGGFGSLGTYMIASSRARTETMGKASFVYWNWISYFCTVEILLLVVPSWKFRIAQGYQWVGYPEIFAVQLQPHPGVLGSLSSGVFKFQVFSLLGIFNENINRKIWNLEIFKKNQWQTQVFSQQKKNPYFENAGWKWSQNTRMGLELDRENFRIPNPLVALSYPKFSVRYDK